MEVGCYVTVNDGGNYVTFHEVNVRKKMKTIAKAQLASRRLGGFLLCLRFIYLFFFNRAAAGVRWSSFTRSFFFFFSFVGDLA